MIPLIDPSDVAVFRLAWSDLPTSTTIGTVTHSVPSPLTKVSETTNSGESWSEVKVSGAVHGGVYQIEGQTTLSNGEVLNRNFPVRCFNG